MGRAGILVMLIVGALAALPIEAATVADEVRRLAPDPGRAVRVDGFSLQAGPATVTLESGILVPSTPVAGRPVELAFVGRGRVEVDPPDSVEAGQLEVFTGAPRLDEVFERAVLVVALDAAVDAVLARPPAPHDASVDEAAALYRGWLDGAERALLAVDARLFADGVGEALAEGTFAAALDSRRFGRFLVVVDPLADEQVTVGRFVRPELSRREQRQVRRQLDAAQRSGKLIGLDADDLGVWDTWMSASLTAADGEGTPGTPGVEPVHYRIRATLSGAELALSATARLRLRALVAGLRTVTLEIDPELAPERVTDGRGRELDWWRSRNELVAALAEPVSPREPLEIVIDYGGRPLDRTADGAWALRRPTGWYPRAGSIDRATYDVELTWPTGLEVVAPGALEELETPDAGTRRGRWRVDLPALGTSFEIGRFVRAAGRAGDVAVDVAVAASGSRADRDLAGEILATTIDAVDFFSGIFGRLPLDRLQVVGSPRGFSQGLPGLVTLSAGTTADWREWGAVLGIEDRRTVIAHEVAHQWWGNLVGWRSYRDQWISEAMANYAANLWASRRLSGPDAPVRGPTAGWRAELLQLTADGRPVESLGPVVVGERLRSSLSDSAYGAVVYTKGAVVLGMLAQLFGEDVFIDVLGEVVEAASGKMLSTAGLLEALERLGGLDLEWFGRQYVLGTGLPEIAYSCRFEQLPRDRWAVIGDVRQRSPVRSRYRVVETTTGGLDVRRRNEPRLDVEGSRLVVPVQVGTADRTVVAERVVVAGRTSEFRIELDRRPEVVWLDRDAEVFGRFVAAGRQPRLAGFLDGLELVSAGDPDGARAVLEAALAVPVAVPPPGWEAALAPADADADGRRLDARIRLALARLHLDAGRLGDARTQVAAARDLVAGRDRWLLAADLLAAESRLDLMSGNPKRAFRRLRDDVFVRRGVETPEAWALLAVAAHAAGDPVVLEQAARRAAALGVDLGPLARAEG